MAIGADGHGTASASNDPWYARSAAPACESVKSAFLFHGTRQWRPPPILIAGSLYLARETLALHGMPPD